MRVSTYQAHNVLKISDVDWDLAGHHLFLVGGKNDQGKTSALKALLMALCGRSGMDYPEVALREGQDEGWVKVRLDPDEGEIGLTVELLLKRRRSGQVLEKFRILDDAGKEFPEPRTLLKRLCQLRAFDPLHFERLDRKGKRELLQELVGLDFSQQKKEYRQRFDERTAVNRDGKKLAATVEAMPRHENAPDEEVSVAALVQWREQWRAQNDRNAKERERLAELAERHQASRSAVASLEEQIKKLSMEREGAMVAEGQLAALVEAQKANVDALEDRDLSEVDGRIAGAEGANRKVRENWARRTAEERLKELRDTSKRLSDRLAEIQEAQEKTLQDAKWPVDGLSFDDEGVLFEGLPFEQAAKSRRVLVSARIGMALNPKLRLLVSQDGNDLDEDSIRALEKVLEEKDFQMIVEMVTRGDDDESRCAVVIEDGRPKSSDRARADVLT